MSSTGLMTRQKLHGIETDFFWLNEAIETSKDDFDQLEQRCKGKWILDYNPSTDEHWIYDNVLKRDDVVSDSFHDARQHILRPAHPRQDKQLPANSSQP
jgi:hypothetical protein